VTFLNLRRSIELASFQTKNRDWGEIDASGRDGTVGRRTIVSIQFGTAWK
jgi:hypothetical protein